jgi:hypothetical protein
MFQTEVMDTGDMSLICLYNIFFIHVVFVDNYYEILNCAS